MKNPIIITLLSVIILLFSCNPTPKNTKLNNTTKIINKDTLVIEIDKFENTYSSRTLFVHKKIVHHFIKGDTTFMFCKYNKQYDNVFKNVDVNYRAEDTSVKIYRTNNNRFYVYIPKEYSKKELLYQSYLKPHSNFFIKYNSSNEVIDSKNIMITSTLLWKVK